MPPLDADLRVRISSIDRDRIDAVASADGLSRNGWIRKTVAAALPDIASVPATLPPSPPRRPRVVPDADVAAVADLVGALGRATGAAIQVAKGSRESGFARFHVDAESAVAALRRASSAAVDLLSRLTATEAEGG